MFKFCPVLMSFFRYVLIKLRHCEHLALSSCLKLKLRGKLVIIKIYNSLELKACVRKLCVLLYSAVMFCVAACLVCQCGKLRLSTYNTKTQLY